MFSKVFYAPNVDANPYKLIQRVDSVNKVDPQILNTISHELRTPIAIISSNIQLLKDSGSQADLCFRNECLELCAESVESLKSFFDSIQLITMAAKNQIHPSFSVFRVKQITHNLFVVLAKQNLNFKRITLDWDLMIPKITSDLYFLQLIIISICSNAIKFSRGEINLTIQTNQNHLVLCIQDRGIGIPEDEFDLIFSPFYRARNISRIPGAGLGLAVVSALTNSMEGEIFLSSKMGLGTSIIIRFNL